MTGWTGPGWDYRVISLFGPEPDRELRITWGPITLHLEAQYRAAVALVGSLNEVDPDGGYTLQRAASQAWESIPAPAPAEVEEAADAPA